MSGSQVQIETHLARATRCVAALFRAAAKTGPRASQAIVIKATRARRACPPGAIARRRRSPSGVCHDQRVRRGSPGFSLLPVSNIMQARWQAG
jgi:hypothetical protein